MTRVSKTRYDVLNVSFDYVPKGRKIDKTSEISFGYVIWTEEGLVSNPEEKNSYKQRRFQEGELYDDLPDGGLVARISYITASAEHGCGFTWNGEVAIEYESDQVGDDYLFEENEEQLYKIALSSLERHPDLTQRNRYPYKKKLPLTEYKNVLFVSIPTVWSVEYEIDNYTQEADVEIVLLGELDTCRLDEVIVKSDEPDENKDLRTYTPEGLS